MSIQLVGGSYYDFDQLAAELTMAGEAITSLGTDGTTIFTYDAAANQVSLSANGLAVVSSHVPAHLQRDLLALQMQPAVGLPVRQLSPDFVQLLIAGLAYNAGAVDKATLAVLPIDRWLGVQ